MPRRATPACPPLFRCCFDYFYFACLLLSVFSCCFILIFDDFLSIFMLMLRPLPFSIADAYLLFFAADISFLLIPDISLLLICYYSMPLLSLFVIDATPCFDSIFMFSPCFFSCLRFTPYACLPLRRFYYIIDFLFAPCFQPHCLFCFICLIAAYAYFRDADS